MANPATPTGTPRIPASAWLGLAVLMAFYLLSFIDKQMLALMANILGHALALTDLQIGLLQGFVFSIPYAAGVVITGMAVDRYSRRAILFVGVLVWSLMAAASGLSSSFQTLAVFRGGLGLAESVLIPTAMSVIATLFPRERVSVAIGAFYASASAGGIVAVMLGSAIIEAFVRHGVWRVPILGLLQPWQSVFLVTGLSGLALAFLALALPIDDRRRRAPSSQADATAIGTQTFTAYARAHGFFLLTFLLGSSCGTLCSYTLITWSPAYFGRAYGWSHPTIGLVLAMGLGLGAVGNIFWGAASDTLKRRGHADAVYRVYIPILIVGPVLSIAAFMVKAPAISLPAYALSAFIFLGLGPAVAALQLAAPSHLRGRLTGAGALVSALVGLGLGPMVAGFLTTDVFHDRNMLGPAIVISLFGASLLAAACLAVGRGAYRRAVMTEDDACVRPPA